MNCQDFEQIIGDLARRRPIDAGARAEALAHERACERCAARLSDERSLSAGLRALAATMKQQESPARAEASLRAAFRARAAEAGHAAATPAPATPAQTTPAPAGVLPFARPRADKQWTWKKTLATAATAAAAAAVALAVFVPRESTTRTPGPSAAVTPAGPAPAATAPAAGTQFDARVNVKDESDARTDDGGAVMPRAFAQRQPVRAPVMYASTGAVRRPQATRPVAAAEPEVTTEFFPVAHGGGLASGEGGQIVRVELPRTALASFGLPVNVETAGGRVRADVLLGEDGTARAIRFVR